MPIKPIAQIRAPHITNTLFLLVGKSGSGKDTMADLLLKLFGLKKVKSVATRNPRYEGEDTYYFVSDEEYDAANLCQHVIFSGCRYGAAVEEVNNSSLFAICPNGIPELLENYKHRPIVAIYLDTTNETRRERMIKRGDAPASIETRIKHDAESFGTIPEGVTVHTVDANQDVESVLQQVLDVIKLYEPEHDWTWKE